MENEKQHLGFWRLMGAYVIDFLIFALVSLCVVGLFMLAKFLAGHAYGDQGSGWFILFLFSPIIVVADVIAPLVTVILSLGIVIIPPFYFASMGVLKGGSLGKKWMGLGIMPCSFGRIFGAYMLDMIFVSVGFIAFALASATVLEGASKIGLAWLVGPILGVAIQVFPALYFAVLESSSGCSLGKKICGLRVYKK